MNPIRIVLAEDHTLVRAGIRALLKEIPGIEVVAEASDGREAIRLVETHEPDILLTDIAMPDLNGLEAVARLSRNHPRTRVIVLSMHVDQAYVRQALKAGAAGYLVKGSDVSELVLALKAVAGGKMYLSPAVSKSLVQNYLRGSRDTSGRLEYLTSRQREILQLIAEGRSTKEIAQHLHLSIKTVETHRASIMKRLDIHNVAGLVRFAIQIELIMPDA